MELARWGASVALIDIHEGRLMETVQKCLDVGLSRDKVRLANVKPTKEKS